MVGRTGLFPPSAWTCTQRGLCPPFYLVLRAGQSNSVLILSEFFLFFPT